MLYSTQYKECLTFQLNWTEFLPKVNSQDWDGPIVVRSPEYLKKLSELLTNHPNRIIHNSLVLLFLLDIVSEDVPPTPLMCTHSVVCKCIDYLNISVLKLNLLHFERKVWDSYNSYQTFLTINLKR